MIEVIKVLNTSFGYEDTLILDNISFTVRPGEFIHILGPNGGGKSTLLKLLMGFIEPDQGTVKLFGTSPEKARTKVAYVPQIFPFDRLFPISVFEVVLSARLSKLPWHGLYRKEDKEMALNALKEVNLIDQKDMPMGSLSGGQLQRALIARALAAHPEILLLDEPTSCIDFSSQLEVESILNKLKGKMTIVMVSHDLEHIGKNADRVLCVHGKLYELKPKDVCQHFSMGLYPHAPHSKSPIEVLK
jgi:zinc transport system ATP-binding protein